MTIYIATAQPSKLYVGASAVDKLYAGTNLVWQSADTTPPSQPPSFTASVSGTSASLAWGVSTDDVGVTGYKVYRGATLLTTTTSRTYTDSSLNYSTSYTWSVSAIDAAGNESTKATASGTSGAAPGGGGGGGGGGGTTSYPYTAWSGSYEDRPFNGADSGGAFTIPASYSMGSFTFLSGVTYQVSCYFYADSSQLSNTSAYANGFQNASFSASNGAFSSPTGTASTSSGGWRWGSPNFTASGTATIYINVGQSYYCGPGGTPMVIINAVSGP